MEGDSECYWSRLPSPMSLKIIETNKTDLFIAASLDFLGAPIDIMTKNHKGSLYYKIEVNGEPVVQYHVSNPRDSKRAIAVNLHAKAEVPAVALIIWTKVKIVGACTFQNLKVFYL